MGGDWFFNAFTLPYQFSIGNWQPPTDRPPLFSLIIYLLNKNLTQFWITQLISIILSSLYLIPSYFLAKKIFNTKTAMVSTLFLIFIPFMAFQVPYTWPKTIASFWILSVVYLLFYSDNKYKFFISGLFLGISYLFHNYAIFYIIPILAISLYKYRYDTIKSIILFILTVVPYYLWIYSSYHSLPSSNFIYYPFATDYETALVRPETVFPAFFNQSLFDIVSARVANTLITILPITPLFSGRPTYEPLLYYTHTFPGGLGVLLYISIIYSLFKYKLDKIVMTIIAVPFILYILLFGWKIWGLLPVGLHPSIPFLVMIGVHQKSNKILLLLFLSVIIETVIFISLYQLFFTSISGFQDVQNLLEPYNITINNFKSIYEFIP